MRLNTSSEEVFGKIAENLLRKAVTGKGAESLAEGDGLHQLALKHAPKPTDIESDIKKLKYALIKKGKTKSSVRLTPETRRQILKERVQAIGYTARTLLFDWAEALGSRSAKVTGKLAKYHSVIIATSGRIPKATFRSTQKGLLKIDSKHNIVRRVMRDLRSDIIPYARQVIRDQFIKDTK